MVKQNIRLNKNNKNEIPQKQRKKNGNMKIN